MKFGCFGNLSDYDTIEALGFDSIELSLEEINTLSDEEFNTLRQRSNARYCKPHVISRLIPLEERIGNINFDEEYWLLFFRKGAERTVALGGHMWVFGCGKPRCLPETEPDRSFVRNKVDAFILKMADILSIYNILLLLEPLGNAYSNYIGTICEAVSFIERYRHKNIATMCDLRHMVSRGENFETLPNFCTHIRHAHIDCPVGEKRIFPRENDGYDYANFFSTLRRMNYSGILTIEAPDCKDLYAEGEECLSFLKNMTVKHNTAIFNI
jgi:sugar phosphate isomerase/epimerase